MSIWEKNSWIWGPEGDRHWAQSLRDESDRNREIGRQRLDREERARVHAQQHPDKPETQPAASSHEMWHAFGPPFKVGYEWHATWTRGVTYRLTDAELEELRERHKAELAQREVAPPPASPEPMPEGWKVTPEGLGGLGIGFLSWEQLRALLATQGLHIVDEASAKVLSLASDVAANFGQRRSAELEINFMRAVNDMLKAHPDLALRAAQEKP